MTRRYRFSASHRLHRQSLTREENQRLYGKCNNPYGHGHDYVLEVTCGGQLDSQTGLLLDGAKLDALVQDRVLSLIASRNINLDVPEFQHLVPTTENMADVILQRLLGAWTEAMGGSAWLVRVHVQETDRNGFEIFVGAPAPRAVPEREVVSHA